MTMQEGAFVRHFAIQVPTWLAIVILIGAVFGLWKLMKFVWAAISN
jgi:hypothetical protein